MNQNRFFNGWTLAVTALALIIVAGGVLIFLNIRHSPGVEISFAPIRDIQGRIYVSGEFNNPGVYPVFAGDSLEDIIQAAGGLKNGADLNSIELSVGTVNTSPQKINLNRAQAWLLEALPGVGEAKAQAIIVYRESHGYFHSPDELLNVPGFSEGILSKIKGLVTVND